MTQCNLKKLIINNTC